MAATDIVTISEASAYLQSPSDTDGIAGLISAASSAIDDVAGPVVKRTVTDIFDGRGQSQVVLRTHPVASVTTVDEYVFTNHLSLTQETNSAKPGLGFTFDPVTNTITRRTGGIDYIFWAGRQNVVVTYVAGRYADTASVDPRFKQACLITLAHIWRSEQGTPIGNLVGGPEDTIIIGSGYAVPRRALELLGLETQLVIGIA